MFLKGKSGWCSTICPLLPVQRIYGQTPLMLVANAHCQPCVGCVKNCYDFNPRAAYLADLQRPGRLLERLPQVLRRRVPGPRARLLRRPGSSRWRSPTAVSLAVFATLTTFFKTSAHTITSLFGAIAFAIFYSVRARTSAVDPLTYALRAAAIALAATWFVRTLKQGEAVPGQARDRAAASAPQPGRRRPASPAPAACAPRSGGPQVTFLPDNKRVAPKPGQTLLEIAEANGLPIEAGCRMGICGADPVAIKDGMSCTSRDLRRREGHARAPRLRREHPAWRAA